MIYKISYLSNGKKVKITNELFNQLKKWEMEGVMLPIAFVDELKIQDNAWINSNRNYYTHINHNEQHDYQICSSLPIVNHILNREKLYQIYQILKTYSGRQRRRFIMHFYYGYSYSDIAVQEGVHKKTIRKSIQKVRGMGVEPTWRLIHTALNCDFKFCLYSFAHFHNHFI